MGGAAQFTLRCGRRLNDGAYQKPLVALIFNHSSSLLGMEDVKVLFHEFGHALNSLLSRTEFQHLAGEAYNVFRCGSCPVPGSCPQRIGQRPNS